MARERDTLAAERDRLADDRDRVAELRDQRAREIAEADDSRNGALPEAVLNAVKRGRWRAASDRAQAASDRADAARDRRRAAQDREMAARDREYAGTDELTGVRRRGVGLAQLEEEIERAHRSGEGLVVAFVDVDGLKAINDVQGHGAGDQVLRDVADALRRHVRSYDLVLRLGGDEFLCGMPGATLEEARRRLTELTAELRAETGRSVSVGLTELRTGDSSEALVERADQELLAARSG